MVDWLETSGFGDRARRDGDATHVDEHAERRMRMTPEEVEHLEAQRQRLQRFMTLPEPADDEPSPLFNAVVAAAVAGFVVTTWFLLLDMCHAGHWTPAEVTAPLWGLLLLGAAATLVVAIGLGAVDAWDAHCLRRAIRRGRRP